MKRIFLTFLVFLACTFSVNATTYDYYFADGEGAGTCLVGDPCSTLVQAQALITAANTDDIVNLHFNGGDTWTTVVDTSAAQTAVQTFGLYTRASSSDPIVNILSYGSGKAIFDGQVTDFSAVPSHNTDDGPLRWTHFLDFQRSDCSVSNVEIKGMYGHAIQIKDAGADGFELSDSTIYLFGNNGLETDSTGSTYHIQNNKVENNTFHTGQQLYLNGKITGWGPAIDLNDSYYPVHGNEVRYNVIYDIGGEGISAGNALVEYNIIGDTVSTAINMSTHGFDGGTAITRYNLVTHSDLSSSIYDNTAQGHASGIRIYDERSQSTLGNNQSCDFSIYGNIVINRNIGIKIYDNGVWEERNHFGLVKVYNNTIIDSHTGNFYTGQYPASFDEIYFYNNVSILYDQTGAYHTAGASVDAGWDIDYNAFWTTGGSPTVPADWQGNYVTSDPKLEGEETSGVDWDGQSGATYFSDITFANVTPESDSGLIGTGKTDTGFEATLLSQGTDFSVLPDTQTFVFQEASHNSLWDIGAIVADYVASTISGAAPSGEQTCTSDPRNVIKSWNTNSTASVGDNCRISLVNEGYVAMGAGKVADTTDSTSHSNTDSEACDAAYTYYVDCSDHAGNITGQSAITYSIESGDPPDPGPGTVGTVSGGGCSGGSM